MAQVTPIPEIPESPMEFPGFDLSQMNLIGELVSPVTTPARFSDEDVVYVAVGKDMKESEVTLAWALRKFGGRKICIVHVHTPAQKIPIMGIKVGIDRLETHKVRAYHEKERLDMHKILDNYVLISERAGVRAVKLCIEMDSIENGILELISRHGIRKLVMGAATSKCYSKKMTELKSKKAIYVRLQAPLFCYIWFVCKGNLIHTRVSKSEGYNTHVASPSSEASPYTVSGQHNIFVYNEQVELKGGVADHPIVASENHRISFSALPASDETGQANFPSSLGAERTVDAWGGTPEALDTQALHHFDDRHSHSYPHNISAESVNDEQSGTVNVELYDRLEQYAAEAKSSRQAAFEESIRCRKAERDAIEARRMARASETIYVDELRQRREIEQALARGKEEVEKMKLQLNEVMEDLKAAQEQKSSLEYQIANSDYMAQELEQKTLSAVNLSEKYKKERDELQVERNDALRLAEELRDGQAKESTSTSVSRCFAEFSFSEIEEATCKFDPSLKIGEGGYGSIYRGILRHTQVEIKMLHPLQGPSEFHQEVNILSKLRHPNIVTLVGACSEAWTLVYEGLPNGSLEDRLSCKNNTAPLPWQTRISIAAELCSALIFLHSCTGQGIVYGDLKPENILLDANFVSKLCNFENCRVLSQDDIVENGTTLSCRADPNGTFAYMDPEFLATGELTPKSDVYSFGIILLRLLTGRPVLGIAKETQNQLDNGTLYKVLDPTAGDWPIMQAKNLARLAMNCCQINRSHRPELSSEVWKVIQPMLRPSCGLPSSRMGSEENREIPSHFICPISQEMMKDPVVAVDGFTYESEAMREWFNRGHMTSPMTNLKMPYTDLLPNHTLRSAMQEWLQHH